MCQAVVSQGGTSLLKTVRISPPPLSTTDNTLRLYFHAYTSRSPTAIDIVLDGIAKLDVLRDLLSIIII